MIRLLNSLFWLLSLISLPTILLAAETPAPPFFGLTNLWTLHLTISDADWQRLGSRGGPRNPMMGNGGDGGISGMFEDWMRGLFGGADRAPGQPAQSRGQPGKPGVDGESRYPWTTCTVESEGQTLTNVGIRFKGVSSLVRAPNGFKRPFKLDFDRHTQGRQFRGIGEFYLNNNVNDATQLREALAYELFRRAGLAAPRTAFARVTLTIPGRIDHQHLGLYTAVEVVGGDFLRRNFGTKKGLLVKPERMHGLQYLGEDWDTYKPLYNPKGSMDPADTRRLIDFARFIQEANPDEFRSELKDFLDPEKFARFVALNSILANIDSFIGNGHNYYVHMHPASHRATFIPWDLNEAFGMHPVSGRSGHQMEFSILRPNADPNRLIQRFISDPSLGPLYREQCSWLLTNIFVPATLSLDIDRIAAVTKPVVFAESKRARADFERTVLRTLKPEFGDTSQPRHDREFKDAGYRPWGFPEEVEIDNMPLKDWIAGRQAHALGQLEGRVRGTLPRARIGQ